MSVLFISDLHLSPERPEVTRAFLAFLQQRAAQASALYVLGDLFEAWIGDDDPSDLSLQVQSAFRALSNSGTELFIQQGNRDFMLGKRFMANTGATLLPDEHLISYQGCRALVMHGDSLCTDDADYQRFRRKARHPVYRWLLAKLPVKRRQRLASDWRAKSKAANSNKPSAIMDVNAQAVAAVMSKWSVETLIHGHTHRPDRHRLIDGGERIVLGDWHDYGWALSLENGHFDLQKFSLTTT
ncbi:MAG: UDP-2,3-diacylglucosamine diphosphatase [Porticoccaceae bacterium]|nr:UDP-2,3-diacylglucosamine diphosphatase [Porticoccaceae bacterium]MBT7375542.1 UDP-2,3-diacylglucosamine diphosphatase [Porticoccaceae bacterium]